MTKTEAIALIEQGATIIDIGQLDNETRRWLRRHCQRTISFHFPIPKSAYFKRQAPTCPDCGEMRTSDAETTWQQWQCECCGSWNDR
jgi:hypothetical protein